MIWLAWGLGPCVSHLRSSVCVCVSVLCEGDALVCKVYANAGWSLKSDWRWQSSGGVHCVCKNPQKRDTQKIQTDRSRGPLCFPTPLFNFSVNCHDEASFCEYWFTPGSSRVINHVQLLWMTQMRNQLEFFQHFYGCCISPEDSLLVCYALI